MIQHKKHKMDINTIVILLTIGFFTGILGGMVGVGGGIILVPALVFILGYSQLDAQGISLALIMFPVGILGVLQYYKQGHVDFNIVLILAIGFVLGSFLGSKISLSISQEIVKRIFAILLLVIATKMLFFDKKKTTVETKQVENVKEKSHQ